MQPSDLILRSAIIGANKYLEHHNKKVKADLLVVCVLRHINKDLPQAIADAKEAEDLGMYEVAKETFASSMILAGIAAAKEAITLSNIPSS